MALARQPHADLVTCGDPDVRSGSAWHLPPVIDPPARCTAWRLHTRPYAAATCDVLEQTARGHFFRLTARGRFVWEAIDGRRSVADLRRAFRLHFGEDDGGMVAVLLAGLAQHGFLRPPGSIMPDSSTATAPSARLTGLAHRMLTATAIVEPFDARLTVLYRRLGRYSYTPCAQICWLLLAAGGGVAFLSLWLGRRVPVAAGGTASWLVPLLLVLGWLVHMPLLELQHALTAKHFGRRVRRIGIGWFWFVPICWTDTSDMWLEGRRRRLAVDVAGPYANLVLGGTLTLVVLLLPAGALQSGLFDVAALLYAGFLGGLNPLLENDGYYLLQDLMDTHGLRERALHFLASGRAFRHGQRLSRAEQGYVLYALCGLGYMAIACWQILVVYQTHIEGLLTTRMPRPAAEALGWCLPALFVLLVGLGMAHELARAQVMECAGGEALEQRINK
ncbi:MAG TPA: PqqD family protein [Chloroflexota bacterium]|jgi:hypothetical protein|nr:PqqD family protein [Chloroflexota bacterium]